MSLRLGVDSSYKVDTKTDLQDQKFDAANLPDERSLGLTTTQKEENAKFQEGGIRGWAAVIGA